MIVADKDVSLVLTGTGDVLEPEDGICSASARAATTRSPPRARCRRPRLDAEAIVRSSMRHRRRHLRLHQPQSTVESPDEHDRPLPRAKSSPNSTASSSARTTPSARSPSHCATAGAACSSPDAARGSDAEEHPDDRPDRLGKTEISRRLARLAQRAVPEGRGDQVHRGRLCRPRRRADHPRPRRGRRSAMTRGEKRKDVAGHRPNSRPRSASCDALVGAERLRRDPRRLPQEAARRRTRRQGDRDRGAAGRRRHADCSRFPACPAPHRRDQSRRHLRQGGAADQDAQLTVREALEPLIAEESDKLLDRDAIARGDRTRSRTTASSSSTRSTRSAPARAAAAPTSRARACSATCCR